jgi:hypothetical protein
MPRKGPVPKRSVLPDPRYGSQLVSKFINRLMHDGEKSVAEGIFYKAVDALAEKAGEDPLKAFEKPWATSGRTWRSSPGGSAAPPIRCPWKYAPSAGDPGHPLDHQLLPPPAARRAWPTNCPGNSWMLTTIAAER